jgi:hypothetical protein
MGDIACSDENPPYRIPRARLVEVFLACSRAIRIMGSTPWALSFRRDTSKPEVDLFINFHGHSHYVSRCEGFPIPAPGAARRNVILLCPRAREAPILVRTNSKTRWPQAICGRKACGASRAIKIHAEAKVRI